MEETDDYVKRMEELMGPNVWQEHRSPTPEPVPEPQQLIDISSDPEQSSDLPNTPPKKDLMASAVWSEIGLAKGERITEPVVFVPWKLVKSYPHMYIGKTNAQRAKHFFDNPTIHKHLPWDLFYIYDPGNLNDRIILLVPTYQFKHLLDVINDKLDTVLTIPGHKNAAKFNIMFGIGGSPVPRFLGRSKSMEEFEALKKSVPPFNPEDDISRLATLAQDDFLEKLKNIRVSSKGTKTKKSEKKRLQRIQDHRSWGKSIKRVQRYLGIRKQASQITASDTDIPNLEKLNIADMVAKNATLPVPVVAPPEQGVVFVAIDIEAYEFSPGLITEIGVAVFDTLDTVNQPPGDKGTGWFTLVRGHHFRIKENSWATNKVHVDGNADRFNFGTTEFISEHRVKKLISNIIDHPLSLGNHDDKAKSVKRPVVLVFHDQEADLKYLDSLGYDIERAKNILEIVDTRDIYQHRVKAMNPASLERVLDNLQIPSRFLHNAGNDAAYTMQAMIGLAFAQRQKSLERALEKAKAAEKANGGPVARPKDEEGWLTGGELSDGGKPGEKGRSAGWMGSHLPGKAFQPGAEFEDAPSRSFPHAPIEKSNVFSWSDNEGADSDW